MVFMVGDDDDPVENEEELEEQSGEEKATLDESDIEEQSEEVPRALQKVELDLDDAPFLEEEEEEEEEEDFEEEAPEEAGVAEKKKKLAIPAWLTSKKVIFAAIGAMLLIIAILLAVILTGEEEEAPPPEEVPAEAPVQPEEPVEEQITVPFETFWIEKTDESGKVRFLHIKFSVETTNPAAAREIKMKMLTLRDAVYYYLRNKDFPFLADTENMDVLKEDILSVVNKFLGNTQLEILLIEEYLVQ